MATATERKQFVFDLRKNPQQEPFMLSHAKYAALIGGVGSGKTMAGCMRAILRCRPGYDGVIVAPTYRMSADVVQRTLFYILDSAGAVYTKDKSNELIVLRGATIFFRSADNPERLRGLNLNWAYLDEAALMSEMTWRIILGRLRVGDASAWITTTPAGFNWVWRYWVSEKTADYVMYRGRTAGNLALPKEYVQDLQRQYVGEFAAQELDGEFVAFEGLVYSEFRNADHVYAAKELPKDWARYVLIDYGYENPFCALWVAVDGDGRMWVYRELYRSRVLITENAKAVKKLCEGEKITDAYDDWDSDNHAIMLDADLPFSLSRARKGDVTAGIARVKARLKKRGDGTFGLNISDACPYTIKEFGMYRWPEVKENRAANEEPMKNFDHAMDDIRYLCNALDAEAREVMGVDEHLRRHGDDTKLPPQDETDVGGLVIRWAGRKR